MPPVNARPRSRSWRTIHTGAGIALALGAAELALRVVMSPVEAVLPAIATDSLRAPAVTIRQIEEGVATAHFSVGGARLTGNAPLDSAPTVVIIGDSYVVAREVADDQTMGSRLERRARQERHPINVRQYGWRGASPARYVVSAPDVLSRWHPAVVVVPLSIDDLDERAVSGDPPFLYISADARPRVAGAPVAREPAGLNAAPEPPSVLAHAIHKRWRQIWDRAPRRLHRLIEPASAAAATPVRDTASAGNDASSTNVRSAGPELIPLGVVRALKSAYGDRLAISFLADVRVTGGERPDSVEVLLLAACRSEGVTCMSTRARMLEARRAGIAARGFPTTTLGVGHLNREGHRLVAEELWALVKPRLTAEGR